MHKRIEKIRDHVSENKDRYIVGVCCTVVGGSVMFVVGRSDTGAEIAQKIIQIGFKNESTNNVVINLVERSTPSKPVHLVGTNLYFNSLSEAARKTGHHLSQLSKHINGHLPDLNGDVFEVLEKA